MCPTKIVDVVVGSQLMMSPVVAVVSVPPKIGVAAWPVVVPSLAPVVADVVLVVVVVPDWPHEARRIATIMKLMMANQMLLFFTLLVSSLSLIDT